MKKQVFFVGIKGVAMTALAVYFSQKGYKVCGSDVVDTFATDAILKKYKIAVKEGFKKENIDKKYDLVVVTGAHGGMTNAEAVYAQSLKFPTYMHGEILGKIMDGYKGISIAGCHGKTTTTSMIASLLTHAGLDPSYAVGTASIVDLGAAGHAGRGIYFIAEADEYMTCPVTCNTPRFLWQHPQILVVTNIEFDHPDAYKDIEEVKKTFLTFIQNIATDGLIVMCIDNKNVQEILPKIKRKVVTYGFSPQADYRISDYSLTEGKSFMRVSYKNIALGEFMLVIPGRHNLLNALAASVVAKEIGLPWDKIRDYLKYFQGTKRRFEKIGQSGKLVLYDDYAHHPSEIQATISAARAWFPRRKLIVLFQPHTFSRTKSLLNEFAKSFMEADFSLITEIYPSAREKYDPTISSEDLVYAGKKHKNNLLYKKDKAEVLKWLEKNLSGDDLVITMGAGDIFLWHQEILDLFTKLNKHECP